MHKAAAKRNPPTRMTFAYDIDPEPFIPGWNRLSVPPDPCPKDPARSHRKKTTAGPEDGSVNAAK
jgi:hypothetical protein